MINADIITDRLLYISVLQNLHPQTEDVCYTNLFTATKCRHAVLKKTCDLFSLVVLVQKKVLKLSSRYIRYNENCVQLYLFMNSYKQILAKP